MNITERYNNTLKFDSLKVNDIVIPIGCTDRNFNDSKFLFAICGKEYKVSGISKCKVDKNLCIRDTRCKHPGTCIWIESKNTVSLCACGIRLTNKAGVEYI